MADAMHGKATLVVLDEEINQDLALPAHAEELCVTSVALVLVSPIVLHDH